MRIIRTNAIIYFYYYYRLAIILTLLFIILVRFFGKEVMPRPKIAIVTSYYDPIHRYQTYLMALDSVQCYARMHNYEFIVIDLKNFEYNKTRCAHPDILFKRHCILADYMEKRSDLSYFLFIGADMGVVNPAHKIEEYITPGIDLFFYYRIGILKLTNGSFITPSVQHNVSSINYWGPFDIMADSFILRNTNYTRTFLRYWADSYYKVQYYAFFNDNPILHQVFMDYFAKDKDICFPLLMTAETIIETYEWMACTNYVYGNNWTQEIFDDRVVIRKKYEKMWARDHGEYSIAKNKWSDRDFIAHGWKEQWRSNVDTWFPYKNAKYNFDLTLCGTKDALKNWHYPNATRPEIKIEEAQLDKILDGWVSDVHKYYNDYLMNGLKKLKRICSNTSDSNMINKCFDHFFHKTV